MLGAGSGYIFYFVQGEKVMTMKTGCAASCFSRYVGYANSALATQKE
jgi:hypothetical protein